MILVKEDHMLPLNDFSCFEFHRHVISEADFDGVERVGIIRKYIRVV
jgi:hypothetical protein